MSQYEATSGGSNTKSKQNYLDTLKTETQDILNIISETLLETKN